VINNIRHGGGTPSVDSISTQLSTHTVQRAPVLLGLQQTHGNRYVQRVVAGIQAKLAVGQPVDIYEQEADRVAGAVMRMPDPRVQKQPEEEEEELLQAKPLVEQITPLVQRQVQVEQKEEEWLHAKDFLGQTPEVALDLEARINTSRSGGQPLPASTCAFFEPRFGYDFSHVRVHTDAEADMLNRALNARAFTTGPDIFFQPGAYTPGSSSGWELLAHELTHVVQQTGEGLQRKLAIQRQETKEDRLGGEVQQQCGEGGEQPVAGFVPLRQTGATREESQESGTVQRKHAKHQLMNNPLTRSVSHISPPLLQRAVDTSILLHTYSLSALSRSTPFSTSPYREVFVITRDEALSNFRERNPVVGSMRVVDKWYYYNPAFTNSIYSTRSWWLLQAIPTNGAWWANDVYELNFNYGHTATRGPRAGSFAVTSGRTHKVTDTITGGAKLSYSIVEVSGSASRAEERGTTAGVTVTATNFYEHDYRLRVNCRLSHYTDSDFTVRRGFWGPEILRTGGPHTTSSTIDAGSITLYDDESNPDNLTP
jgi:hypothetical protein